MKDEIVYEWILDQSEALCNDGENLYGTADVLWSCINLIQDTDCFDDFSWWVVKNDVWNTWNDSLRILMKVYEPISEWVPEYIIDYEDFC